MIAAADFLLKVMICSGLLTGFYWLLLRNKLFHQWNRYYLLASVLLSLCIPFTKVTLTQTEKSTEVTYQALQAVTTNENWIEDSPIEQQINSPVLTTENMLLSLYVLVSLIILILFIAAILKIRQLLKTNQQWKIERLTFVETNAKGTPFSFFRFLFWNNAIDFHSEKGQQIFTHELVHVKEKHSADKLLMQLVLIVFWINPFFWLIKKELAMIHEFIADQRSVKNHDTASFAEMILASVYPTVNFPLTNSFFYSPVKRRLLMLTKLQNPKVNYISRLLLLPLLTLIFFAFVLKTKTVPKSEAALKLDKQITVVIDAGHGFINNSPSGQVGIDRISEDEINLALAKKIEALNTDKNLKLIFTRTGKDFVESRERTDFAIANKADLFVSIHANFAPQLREGNKYVENPVNGFEIYVEREGTPFLAQSKELASSIVNEMQGVIALREPVIKQRQRGIWVLQSTNCPTVLLECGFISNKKDAAFLSDEKNQEKMAEAILRGIVQYVSKKETQIISDTISNDIRPETAIQDSALMIINGKIAKQTELKGKTIIMAGRVTVIKPNNKDAILKYGPAAKKGVIIFENATFSDEPLKDTVPREENTVFTKTEIEAQFPGGNGAWDRYIQKIIEQHLPELTKEKITGTCELLFIVDKDGGISNVTALTLKNSRFSEILIDAVKKGPKWIPAIQNGHKVKAWTRKKVAFVTFPDSHSDQNVKEAPEISIGNANFKTLFTGTDNPIIISSGTLPQSELLVTSSNGTITKENNKWIARPEKAGEAIITVSTKERKLSEFVFAVKQVPDPVVSVGGSGGGRLRADLFKSQTKMTVDDGWEVAGFTVYFTGKNFPEPKYIVCNQATFNEKVLELINQTAAGTTVTFDEIRIKQANGDTKKRVRGIFFNLF